MFSQGEFTTQEVDSTTNFVAISVGSYCALDALTRTHKRQLTKMFLPYFRIVDAVQLNLLLRLRKTLLKRVASANLQFASPDKKTQTRALN